MPRATKVGLTARRGYWVRAVSTTETSLAELSQPDDVVPRTCFVIMPITTPDDTIARYSGDRDHFLHVLEHLFQPALEAAGFSPTPPFVRGAQVIQGEIIRHLNESDLVLCDVSTRNSNVFYELGIRTALNKPVCLVVDDLEDSLPFDVSAINTHTYGAGLRPWEIPTEIEKLTDHLRSVDLTGNSMWKFFGLNAEIAGSVPTGATRFDDLLDYLLRRIDQMSSRRAETSSKATSDESSVLSSADSTRRRSLFELQDGRWATVVTTESEVRVNLGDQTTKYPEPWECMIGDPGLRDKLRDWASQMQISPGDFKKISDLTSPA